MPVNIELQNVSGQSFQLLVEQDSYEIKILSFFGMSFVSITRNGEVLIRNVKALINQPILQSIYKYQEHGNFQFFSEDSEVYPSFEDYGATTVFQYITKEEVASVA